MKIWSSVCLILISISGVAQSSVEDIDFDKIPQKKVKRFIVQQIDNSVLFFTDFQPSCKKNSNTEEFNHLKHIFRVDQDIETVWTAYKNSSMAESWNSRSVSFGVLFNKYNNDVLYSDAPEDLCGVDTGQVFFLNLKILRGIYNMAVGMEIIEVDSVNNCIQFSYLKGGKAEGAQRVTFREEADGSTTIVHTSAFRSASKFRDRRLYPFFHEKLIMEFHQNILSRIGNSGNKSESLVLLEKEYQLN